METPNRLSLLCALTGADAHVDGFFLKIGDVNNYRPWKIDFPYDLLQYSERGPEPPPEKATSAEAFSH